MLQAATPFVGMHTGFISTSPKNAWTCKAYAGQGYTAKGTMEMVHRSDKQTRVSGQIIWNKLTCGAEVSEKAVSRAFARHAEGICLSPGMRPCVCDRARLGSRCALCGKLTSQQQNTWVSERMPFRPQTA